MKLVYLCDIDGTLADNSHRSPYDESKVHLDKCLPTCAVIKALINNGDRVIFFSGRTKGCYQMTREWLQAALHLFEQPLELYMRDIGDKRPDTEVKKEMYNTIWLQGVRPFAVFDDRLSVVKMWEGLGLFVFNCNQGLKDF